MILEYFKKIGEANTGMAEPTYHGLDRTYVFRDDEPKDFPSEKIMKIIPEKREGYVKAPKMT